MRRTAITCDRCEMPVTVHCELSLRRSGTDGLYDKGYWFGWRDLCESCLEEIIETLGLPANRKGLLRESHHGDPFAGAHNTGSKPDNV